MRESVPPNSIYGLTGAGRRKGQIQKPRPIWAVTVNVPYLGHKVCPTHYHDVSVNKPFSHTTYWRQRTRCHVAHTGSLSLLLFFFFYSISLLLFSNLCSCPILTMTLKSDNTLLTFLGCHANEKAQLITAVFLSRGTIFFSLDCGAMTAFHSSCEEAYFNGCALTSSSSERRRETEMLVAEDTGYTRGAETHRSMAPGGE